MDVQNILKGPPPKLQVSNSLQLLCLTAKIIIWSLKDPYDQIVELIDICPDGSPVQDQNRQPTPRWWLVSQYFTCH